MKRLRATGDESPIDLENNRFDRLFGFARLWSSKDYVQMENVGYTKNKLRFAQRR